MRAGRLRLFRLHFPALLALMWVGQPAHAQLLPKAYQVWEVPPMAGTSVTVAQQINDTEVVTGFGDSAAPPVRRAFRWQLWTAHPPVDMGPVGTLTMGHALNNTGDIVGDFMLNNVSHAFLYRNGVISDLGSLGAGTWTSATGINDAGQVSGYSQVNGANHAFLWSNGAMMDLGTLGAASLNSHGNRINNLGEVTGYSQVPNSTGAGHAVIYRAGTVIDLGTLGGPSSFGYDINDAGHVAGEASDSRLRLRAALYANGTVKDLGALRPQQESRAFGINKWDQVVGESGADAEPKKAFIYSDSKLVDLTGMIQAGDPFKPYVTLQTAWDINDDGWIVASGVDKRDTNTHAYVLEPIP